MRATDDRLCLLVQIHLFLVLLMAFVLRHVGFVAGSAEDVLGAVVLLLTVCGLLCLVVYHGVMFARRWYAQWQKTRAEKEEEFLVHMPQQLTAQQQPGAAAANDDPSSRPSQLDVSATTASKRTNLFDSDYMPSPAPPERTQALAPAPTTEVVTAVAAPEPAATEARRSGVAPTHHHALPSLDMQALVLDFHDPAPAAADDAAAAVADSLPPPSDPEALPPPTSD